MNTYLHYQYRETRVKFDKFSKRLQKSQEKGKFYRYSKRKQHFLLSRIRKLWEKLRILEVRLKLATLGSSLALILMVSSTHAQQFVEAPDKNPLAPPAIFGDYLKLLDMDNDGDLDILTSFYRSDRITYYRNTGNKTEPLFTGTTESENPFGRILQEYHFNLYEVRNTADVDNDGDMDLLLWNGALLRNMGSNDSIDYEQEVLPEGSKWNYTLGDADGDGDQDVFDLDPDRGVVIRENTGNDENFILSETEQILPVANWNTAIRSVSSLNVADMDNDGDLDITFSAWFGGDHDPDRQLQLVRNIGNPANAAYMLESDANNPYSINEDYVVNLGDLDGDGDFDLIMESYPAMYQYYALENNSLVEDPSMVPEFYNGVILPYSYHPPQFVDFDGDGDLDIFGGEEEVTYYEQIQENGKPRFRKKEDLPLPFLSNYSREKYLSFADLDKDGDEDLLFVTTEYNQDDWSYEEVYLLFENSGSAREPEYLLRDSSVFENITDFIIPSFVDIDDDGDLDIFMMGVERIQGEWTLGVRYFESTGEDPFEFTERAGLNANPLDGISGDYYPDVEYSALQFSDLDHDGDYDAVFNDYYGKIYYLENVGTAAKAEYMDLTNSGPFVGISAGELSSISLVDFDNDGDDDLFTHEYYSMVTRFYENTRISTSNKNTHDPTEMLILYPNPVTSELNIMFESGTTGNMDYEILGTDGKCFAKGLLPRMHSNERSAISTEFLPNGFYMIRFRSGKRDFHGTFIKQ